MMGYKYKNGTVLSSITFLEVEGLYHFVFKEFNQYPDWYLDHYLKWSGRFFFEFVTDMHAFIPQTGIMLSAVPRK